MIQKPVCQSKYLKINNNKNHNIKACRFRFSTCQRTMCLPQNSSRMYMLHVHTYIRTERKKKRKKERKKKKFSWCCQTLSGAGIAFTEWLLTWMSNGNSCNSKLSAKVPRIRRFSTINAWPWDLWTCAHFRVKVVEMTLVTEILGFQNFVTSTSSDCKELFMGFHDFFLSVSHRVFFPSRWLLSHITIIETSDSGEREMNHVAMTLMNPRKEYWLCRGSN